MLPLASSAQEENRDSVILLNEISVVAYRITDKIHKIPGSIAVITGEALKKNDEISLAGVLNTIPGVTMQTGTYITNRIVIRGMGSRTPYNTNRIRVYLDDIPLTSSEGVSAPEEIDISTISRAEIIKGPSSALYGSGLGGTVNLFTSEPEKSAGRAGIQYGSFNTLRTNLSGDIAAKRIKLSAGLSNISSEGYRENNTYRRTNIISSAAISGKSWSAKALVLLTNVNGQIPSSLGKTQFESNPRAAAPFWKSVAGYEKYKKGVAAITLTNRFSDHITGKTTIFGRWNDSFERRPFNNLDDRSLSGGLRSTLNLHFVRTDLSAGAELFSEKYEWTLEKDQVLLNNNRESRFNISFSSLLRYRPTDKITLMLAGALNRVHYRLDDLFPANGDQSGRRAFPLIFSPRAGFNYALSDQVSFYGSAGHGYSHPSPEETLLPAGEVNPDIKPEHGWQYEAGTRLNLLSGLLGADMAFYRIDLNNLLVTKRITEDIFTGINAGKTRHQGIELQLQATIFDREKFPGSLATSVSYAMSDNRFLDFTDDTSVYDGNRLPGIPGRSLNSDITWEPFKDLRINLNLQYTGSQYLNDSNTLEYEGYFVCGLKVTFLKDLFRYGVMRLYGGINNLADTRYASMLIVNAIGIGGAEPRYYYPGLPRNFYLGAEITF